MAWPVLFARCSSGLAVVVGLSFLLEGCARDALPPVDETVQKYERAIAEKDARALHELLSDEAKQTYDQADLARLIELDGAALAAASRTLTREDRTVEVEVELHFEDREVIEVRGEAGGYRVASAVSAPLRTETPEALLRALRRAIEARDLDLVLRLSTNSRRERFEDEIRALGVSLDHVEDAVVDVRGDRAVVHLRDGRTLELALEEGGWRVEEIR